MRRWILPVGAVCLIVVAMGAAAVQGTPAFDPPEWKLGGGSAIEMPTMPPGPDQPAVPDVPPTAGEGGSVVGWILIGLVAIIVAVLLYLLVRRLIEAWRARTPRRIAEAPGTETFAVQDEPDPDAAAPEIRRGIAFARRVIDEHEVPSDAIVAAWVGLEQSASDAGLMRGPAETPAEFALRIITRRSAIAAEARQLLGLYERVRFAGRAATESDRAAARRALEAIEEGWR